MTSDADRLLVFDEQASPECATSIDCSASSRRVSNEDAILYDGIPANHASTPVLDHIFLEETPSYVSMGDDNKEIIILDVVIHKPAAIKGWCAHSAVIEKRAIVVIKRTIFNRGRSTNTADTSRAAVCLCKG
jgi:hypothetical protein